LAFTDASHRDAFAAALASSLSAMRERPLGMTEALLAADFTLGPVKEIAIALPANVSDGGQLTEVLQKTFCPRKALLVGSPGSADWTALEDRIPWLRNKSAVQHPTAFVCANQHCHAPTTDAHEFLIQLLES
jgi:uncharacterized protein